MTFITELDTLKEIEGIPIWVVRDFIKVSQEPYWVSAYKTKRGRVVPPYLKKKAWLKTLTEAQKEIYDQYEAQKVMNMFMRALPMIGIAVAAATLLKLVRKDSEKPLLQ